MTVGRVTLYVATSVDGYVADEDGGVDWLEEFDGASGDDVEGFAAFFESVDCLVMGATTYDQVRGFGDWPYGDRPTYVFTHRDLSPATDAVAFVDGRVGDCATALTNRYEHVWLVGGASLARQFLAERAVDDLRLARVPVLLGGGVPLFGGGYDRQRLRLRGTTTRDGGLVEHHSEILARDAGGDG
jgi:dihydrofolate reductase